jgi:hypothetical protein
MKVAAVLAAVLVLFATGCGAEGDEPADDAAPASLPGSALPDLDSRARPLDAQALAADSLAPGELGDVLDEAGFVMGSEREFFGKTRTFDHVVARALVFRDAAGAGGYLDWLGAHGEDFLGRVQEADVTLPGEAGVAMALAPCGTCKKEIPTFLAGWRRDETVLTLLAAGSGVNAARFSALAEQFDELAASAF